MHVQGSQDELAGRLIAMSMSQHAGIMIRLTMQSCMQSISVPSDKHLLGWLCPPAGWRLELPGVEGGAADTSVHQRLRIRLLHMW
jgi:hypothetical protein